MIRGNCYYTSEALYHLLGGKRAGWKPMQMYIDGESHWFIQHNDGMILDVTVKQFTIQPNYKLARGKGFLTKKPSKRARELINQMLWQRI